LPFSTVKLNLLKLKNIQNFFAKNCQRYFLRFFCESQNIERQDIFKELFVNAKIYKHNKIFLQLLLNYNEV